MDGLLIRLLEDRRGQPGRWFWPCFGPLASAFDKHYWVHAIAPWMSAPEGFEDDPAVCLPYDHATQSDIQLWGPGSICRWADRLQEEFIELWAVLPTDDPAEAAAAFDAVNLSGSDVFIEDHAAIWLKYTDSSFWEMFARDGRMLAHVETHLNGSPEFRVRRTRSQKRGPAFQQAGLAPTWRALNGHAN